MARSDSKVIITCAVTGSVHTPSMSDHLPLTPDQIVENAVGAAEAGLRSCTCMPATPMMAAPPPIPRSST